MLDIAFQYGNGRLQFPDGGISALNGKAQLIRLDLLVPHLHGQLLRPAKAGLNRPLRRLLLAHRLFIVGLQLDGANPDALQGIQPHGDLQAPQLIPENQIFLCCLALSPQGFHLQFQLGDLVVDPHQIFIGALQLPLCLFLAVAEAGDTCRLLKDFPAVGRLHREDLIDAALANDGVTLPAKASVHEQLVDILQAHRATVDVVLTLSGTVVAAGDHYLALIHIEDVIGVVQDQRDLGVTGLLALGCTAEDHVFHLAASEHAGGLLSHNPADGVGNIGFSRSVGSDDGGNVRPKGQHRLIWERLEALDLQCL